MIIGFLYSRVGQSISQLPFNDHHAPIGSLGRKALINKPGIAADRADLVPGVVLFQGGT